MCTNLQSRSEQKQTKPHYEGIIMWHTTHIIHSIEQCIDVNWDTPLLLLVYCFGFVRQNSKGMSLFWPGISRKLIYLAFSRKQTSLISIIRSMHLIFKCKYNFSYWCTFTKAVTGVVATLLKGTNIWVLLCIHIIY